MGVVRQGVLLSALLDVLEHILWQSVEPAALPGGRRLLPGCRGAAVVRPAAVHENERAYH